MQNPKYCQCQCFEPPNPTADSEAHRVSAIITNDSLNVFTRIPSLIAELAEPALSTRDILPRT
jgi:hypothetical protein